MKGTFITIEGSEGVGKSTVMARLHDHLVSGGHDVLATREPGGTPWCEKLRHVLLHEKDEPVHDDAECLLMFAARAQHVHGLIQPALDAGKLVLSDRFVDATYAYQGGGRQIDLARIEALEAWTLQGFRPDLTILLDAPVDVAFERIANRKGGFDRIEQEERTFFERVRQTYLWRAEGDPERIKVVDATQSLDDVCQQVFQLVDQPR